MNIDISKIWPGWIITERLGHGGFGHVYKAVNESTEAVSAVKIVPVTPTEDELTKLKLCGKSDAAIQKLCLTKAEKCLQKSRSCRSSKAVPILSVSKTLLWWKDRRG